jgi:hypothetical protein
MIYLFQQRYTERYAEFPFIQLLSVSEGLSSACSALGWVQFAKDARISAAPPPKAQANFIKFKRFVY